ncbi:hypothetical protein PMIN06_012962 [Paraphaeosphaeria minitans]
MGLLALLVVLDPLAFQALPAPVALLDLLDLPADLELLEVLGRLAHPALMG